VFEILRYVTSRGEDVFGQWLAKLKDSRTRAKIVIRIDRVATGNFGDCKPLREGVFELRIDWGPGYRVYYAMPGQTVVLLLAGGEKRKQPSDIERAIGYLNDYKKRTARK
jgi:putative addiction module killer protein